MREAEVRLSALADLLRDVVRRVNQSIQSQVSVVQVCGLCLLVVIAACVTYLMISTADQRGVYRGRHESDVQALREEIRSLSRRAEQDTRELRDMIRGSDESTERAFAVERLSEERWRETWMAWIVTTREKIQQATGVRLPEPPADTPPEETKEGNP